MPKRKVMETHVLSLITDENPRPSRRYDGGKWVAAISVNGKSKHLGLFEKINDAVSARKKSRENFWV
jgi:hypothetical protein